MLGLLNISDSNSVFPFPCELVFLVSLVHGASLRESRAHTQASSGRREARKVLSFRPGAKYSPEHPDGLDGRVAKPQPRLRL